MHFNLSSCLTSVFSSSVSSGAARLGSCGLPIRSLSLGTAWVARELCFWCGASCLLGLGWFLWRHSLWSWTMACPGVTAPPRVASPLTQIAVPGYVPWGAITVCVGLNVWVFLCMSIYGWVHVCYCECNCVNVSVWLGRIGSSVFSFLFLT